MNEITKAEIRKRLGNITQLQELLLGDKIDEYNYKLQEYQLKIDALATKLEDSQTTIDKRLSQLESKLLRKIELVVNTVDKRQKYDRAQSQSEQHKLQQEIDTISSYSHENIDFLRRKINDNTNSLKLDISQSKSDLTRELSLFRQHITSQINRDLTQLTERKISRTDLADVLFDLCLELKETDKNLGLTQQADTESTEQANANLTNSDTEA